MTSRDELEHPRLQVIAPAHTRSALEDEVLDLILTAGFPTPDVNVPLVLDGTTVVPDFRWPAKRVSSRPTASASSASPTRRRPAAQARPSRESGRP